MLKDSSSSHFLLFHLLLLLFFLSLPLPFPLSLQYIKLKTIQQINLHSVHVVTSVMSDSL